MFHISWSQVGRGGDELEGKYYPNRKMHLLQFYLSPFLFFVSFLLLWDPDHKMHFLPLFPLFLLFKVLFLFSFAADGKGWLWDGRGLVRKSRSWHISSSNYKTTKAEYLNIATFRSIASVCLFLQLIFPGSLFPFLLPFSPFFDFASIFLHLQLSFHMQLTYYSNVPR